MGKVRVNLIIVLVVLAMIALLIIQAFQTAQLYDKKSTQFRNEVQTTLERIAVRHEKAEDVRKFLKIANTNFDGHYKDVLKEEFQQMMAVEESIMIKDTAIMENGKLENYLVIKGQAFDSISGLSSEQRMLARDVRQLRDIYKSGKHLSQDSIDVAIQLDQRILKKMFEKAKFVNEMMIQAFRENVYQKPEDRFDVNFLDSVIRNEFMDDHLPLNYVFTVSNEEGEGIPFPTEIKSYKQDLDTLGTFETKLFPSSVVGEDFRLHVFFPGRKSFLLKEMWVPLLVNLTLIMLIVGAMVFMFRTIITQKKLAELKNDFISNMTHEFKTPISTISLACQAMGDPDMMGEKSSVAEPYVKMINDENQRLSLLVERILQSAILDKGELNLKVEKVNLNEIVHDIVHNAKFRIQNQGGTIHLDATSELLYIDADRMHLSNVISNLVDNAIKYSENEPEIFVTLKQERNLIKISVEDHGLGIKKEHLNKIFDKLYRIPTGNVHNVKGFGLGLSYVKAIANLHGWNVTVVSKYGEGSTFTIEINKA